MFSPLFTVDLESFKDEFFDRIMTPAKDMGKKNSWILAAQVRTTAKRLIKEYSKLSRKKQRELMSKSGGMQGGVRSNPGDPPLSWTGLLKNFILYAWDDKTREAYIGPAKLRYPGQVPHSLEFGVPTLITTWDNVGGRKTIQVPMKARPYMKPALLKIIDPANIKKVYEKSLKPRRGF